MALEHDYFGVIETDADGGMYWSETIEAGDQVIDVSLSTPGGTDVGDEALDAAAGLIASLEDLDLRAREGMLAMLGSANSPVVQYIALVTDELDEDLEDFLVDRSGDLDVDLIRSLQLTRAAIHPHQSGEGEAFVTLEFALDPDGSDTALLTQLTARGETVEVEILE